MKKLATIIDGQALAKKLGKDLSPRLAAVKKARGRPPRLALIAGEEQAAQAYLHAKIKACREIGIETALHTLSRKTRIKDLIEWLASFGRDGSIDGISLDLPLPGGLDSAAVLAAMPADKDVEGMSPVNYGRLFLAKNYEEIGGKLLVPCTALAAIAVLKKAGISTHGKHAVVVGRSAIVGKPTAHLLSALNATVTLCHSRTAGLPAEISRADIVVACLGKPRFIKGGWIKKGAVVIDAGINFLGGKLCGDVDFETACRVSSYITPVPGGVGPVTTAMLLANTVLAAERALRP